MMGLPDGRKSFKIGFSVLSFDTIPACDSQPASHLSIASTTLASVAWVKMATQDNSNLHYITYTNTHVQCNYNITFMIAAKHVINNSVNYHRFQIIQTLELNANRRIN